MSIFDSDLHREWGRRGESYAWWCTWEERSDGLSSRTWCAGRQWDGAWDWKCPWPSYLFHRDLMGSENVAEIPDCSLEAEKNYPYNSFIQSTNQSTVTYAGKAVSTQHWPALFEWGRRTVLPERTIPVVAWWTREDWFHHPIVRKIIKDCRDLRGEASAARKTQRLTTNSCTSLLAKSIDL